jgi:CheY-like chemotaxis protein
VLHLTRLVGDLLDVSRITMGTVQLRHEDVDLVAVAAGAVDSVRPLLDAAGLVLRQQFGPGTVPVRGDSTRLAQCIVNLLTNAAKFTPAGGSVSVHVVAADGLAVIEVSDTGIGIPAQDLERIFELFVQVEQSGMHGNSGLGIGLALTRKLIALHGGSVRAAPAASGPGSVFRIELPLAHAMTPAGIVEAAAPARRDDSATRILVVDDNRDAADTLSILLSMSGFEVSVAYSGESALSMLAHAVHDAVLLDIGLPDIDGYEVCRRVRADTSAAQPVMLALTGWGQEKDREDAAAAGFDAHLSKPADPDRLMAVLTGQLTLARQGIRARPVTDAG